MHWRDFQQLVAQLFRQLGCEAQTDHPVMGVRAKHDVDVWVTFKSHGFAVSWAVECKLWKERVKKAHVLTLRTLVDDVGADKGIVVSQSGFQRGAVASARKTNIALVTPDELRGYLAEHLAGLERHHHREDAVRTRSRAMRAELDALPADAPVSVYEQHLLWSHDQPVQKAAVRRILAVGGTAAVLLLARRLLNPWGMAAIDSAEKALGRLEQEGGALAISTLLLVDSRFYYSRLEVLLKVLRCRGDADTQASITAVLRNRVVNGMHFGQQLMSRLPDDLALLRASPCNDVALGVELSAWYCSPVWAGVVRPSERLEAAVDYANRRLPGLLEVLQQVDLSGTAGPPTGTI